MRHMKHNLSGNRGGAVEEEFFKRHEAVLLERRRVDEQRRAARAALAAASRITDEALLDQLVTLGITADTLIALSLVPLVEVAWADGKLEDSERRAILTAARAAGLGSESAGLRLIESSLSEHPPPRLRELWRHYIKSVCATLSPEEKETLRAEMLQRARSVAEAAGGFMGLGSQVPSQEEALLTELAQAFGG